MHSPAPSIMLRTPPSRPDVRLVLDHLVVAAADLDAGASHVHERTGLTMVSGGQHPDMGTRNRLASLDDRNGPGTYLEVIAIDPDLPAPAQPRWFGLDVPAVRARIAARPALIAWVVRVEGAPDALDALHDAHPQWIGAPQAFSRGDYRWRMALPAALDGIDTRRFAGLFPAFIQWDVPHHPVMRLPASPARLVTLAATHPQPETPREALAAIGIDGLMRIDPGSLPALTAHVTVDGVRRVLA